MAKEKKPKRSAAEKAKAQYTGYTVKEPMELMEFLASKMPDASRTKLKSLLSKRIVYVDKVITTQFNFPLQPGMKIEISKDKGRKEFSNRLLKIVYEDAYIIVVEKMEGLLSVNTGKTERTYGIYHSQRVCATFGKAPPHIYRTSSGQRHFGIDDVCQR